MRLVDRLGEELGAQFEFSQDAFIEWSEGNPPGPYHGVKEIRDIEEFYGVEVDQ